MINARTGMQEGRKDDMQSHNTLWSGAFYLAAGVTTTRDMGNFNSFLLR